uniref:uncharacterized protein LOC128928915 isoform X2 n=1 Tax=Callithrix jacchus TaxID=9483 RepID=UPI0023DD34F6|nr:uncharacterized protein LOC128928915 isoform X2 [Callithrix jacchus]
MLGAQSSGKGEIARRWSASLGWACCVPGMGPLCPRDGAAVSPGWARCVPGMGLLCPCRWLLRSGFCPPRAWRSGPLLPTEDTSRERLSGPKEDPPGRRRRADVGNGQKDVWLQPFQQTPWEREGLRPRAGALPTPDLLGRSKCTDIGKGQRKGVWLQRSLQTPETGVRCLYSQHIVSLCALSFAPCYQMRSPRECCHVITDTRCKRKPSPSSPPSPSPPVQMERRHREVIVCPGLPASWWQSHGSDGMNVVILRRQGLPWAVGLDSTAMKRRHSVSCLL